MEKKSNITFIFLHGAGLGAWIWDDLIANLKYPYLAIDLPGRGEHADVSLTNLSLTKYVESVLLDINKINSNNKLIIVSHSISGIIGLEVANKLQDRVIGFVAISAAIPSKNGSYISCFPFLSGVFLRIMLNLAGTKPPASAIKEGLCNDLDDKITSKIIEKFTPESKKLYIDNINIQRIPDNSLYLYLKKDKALNDAIQLKMIKNLHARQIIEIDSGHLPMFSKSEQLAQILNDFVNVQLFNDILL
jgi:pimeloyl-ACP methyl ester carboxylesterase